MPILEIEIVVAPGETLAADLAATLARAAATVVGGPPSGTWVRLRALDAANYAEGDGGPPAGVRPVFVHLLKSTWPDERERAREAQRLATAVAAVSDRPVENVHVLYLPPGAGRVAFGGRLLPEDGR